ncbi:MAG: outer membrane beta-barrel protein [Saprospiraceae bacterium]|nr:outer membrane beta-barrel protein [Saprospiraceae bacterium]
MNKLLKAFAFFILLMAASTSPMLAQSQVSYGFKAGLNYNTFTGPLDEGEAFDRTTGFHIGIIFKYMLTDIFGLKGEFVYSQRGGEYLYNGSSFFLIQKDPNPILLSGTRDMTLNVSNNYLDFPLLAYGKFGRFELNAGINISLLGGSVGAGQLKFSGIQPPVNEFSIDLDHRYFGDEAKGASNFGTQEIRVSNEKVNIPSQIGGYYEYAKKDGNLYQFLEVGFLVGVSFYLNDGLFLGLRGNYGLVDVTRSSMDRSYTTFTDGQPTLRNDNDKQVSYQLSLGFSF